MTTRTATDIISDHIPLTADYISKNVKDADTEYYNFIALYELQNQFKPLSDHSMCELRTLDDRLIRYFTLLVEKMRNRTK